MKIKIVGAAGGEVTGSCYLVETANAKVMIDAGMFQGGKATEEKNRLPEGVDYRSLDALLLTHAHAGQNDLLKWLASLERSKPKIILTHGENLQREALAAQIEKSYSLKSLLPELNEIVEI